MKEGESGESQKEVSVPKFLMDTLLTMRFRRRAGEWELELPRADRDASSTRITAAFLANFPWASVNNLRLHTAKGVKEAPIRSLQRERTVTSQDDIKEYGFEAELALRLCWVDFAGEPGESDFPGAGRLQFDRESGIVTLTVWPNLFTDMIPIYEENSEGFSSRQVLWAPASRCNRQRLADSLAGWQNDTHGDIISAESELVEGVYRDGFSDSARPL